MFDSTKIDNLVYPKSSSGLNIRSGPSLSNQVVKTVPQGTSAGTLTGTYEVDLSGYKWYQINYLNNSINPLNYGYVREDVIIITPPAFTQPAAAANEDTTAQTLINELTSNDKEIYLSLIRSGNLLQEAESKGLNVDTYKNLFQELTERLGERQQRLLGSSLLQIQQGTHKAYTGLMNAFKNYLLTSFGIYIGALPLAAIVITAIITAGTGVLIYNTFKPDYDESKTDLKVSKELEEALANVTPEKAAIIRQQLEGQIDTAYNQGKTDQAFSFSGLLKYWPYAVAGVALYFISRQSKK